MYFVWRIEDVTNTVIPPGWSATFHDDLEYVGGCNIVRFQLYRRVQECGAGQDEWCSTQWGNVIDPEEGTNVVCTTGANYTVYNP
jgi:hypothetical protein